MIAGATLARFDTTVEPFFSLRAIPELTLTLPGGRGLAFDAEASANVYGSFLLAHAGPATTSGDIKPYRAWARLSTSRFEARLGLQKLSFGSATLFRPLMWFDSLDPRDPLQITDGVYGLLLRYYAKGNANIWAWGLLGNKDRRGFDLAPPDNKTPEFGGRVEVPLFKGEIAATYHHRKTDINGLSPVMSPSFGSPSSFMLPSFASLPRTASLSVSPSASPIIIPPVPEDRFGLDGKWDIGPGVWFEGALLHQRTPLLPSPFQRALTLGLDYTFGLGKGLYAAAEHFRIASSARAFSRPFSPEAGLSFTALLLRYPLGLRDDISGIIYYDWKNRDLYRFISWKHTTDALTFSAIVYWNPPELLVFQGQPGSGSFSGTGIELILAYYF
ncbi:MAG TPA: hypothetical protein VLJ16_11555 [Acidobacteriota bacterium]|nr:hypothetical protein [Acidobacteriota bacterium]